MKLAFDGVAKVLSMPVSYEEDLEMRSRLWSEHGIARGWYRFASEVPKRSSRSTWGTISMHDETKDWSGMFRAEAAKWLAELLDRHSSDCRAVAMVGEARRASQRSKADPTGFSAKTNPMTFLGSD